jgi:hypothetical protein
MELSAAIAALDVSFQVLHLFIIESSFAFGSAAAHN